MLYVNSINHFIIFQKHVNQNYRFIEVIAFLYTYNKIGQLICVFSNGNSHLRKIIISLIIFDFKL